MVVVVQLVRTPDCGSGGGGFNSHHPPKKTDAVTSFGSCIFLWFTFGVILGIKWDT